MRVVWLASYPRSGNTFLRTILWQCFGLRSASLYKNDLGGNNDLEEYVGHIERGPDGHIPFVENSIPLVKTHEYPYDDNPAIYVIRDGRAVTVSLWKFYSGKIPLDSVIDGRLKFGTWSNHVRKWDPSNRPNTLLLEYEDMRNDLSTTLEKISEFLKKDIVKMNIPDRNTIASVDGRWVKNKSDWETEISAEFLGRFTELNEQMLGKMGYI